MSGAGNGAPSTAAGGGGSDRTANPPNFADGLFARIDGEQVNQRSEQMRELVREVIRERLVADRGADAVARTLRTPLPADAALTSADRAQMAEIERMLAPLQRKLATTTLRKRRRRTGPLDVRATVRASMSTGGVPVKVVHRRPTPTKPKLYVLADVSGSVATFAAFTITLVAGLSNLYSKLRTFAFVENAVEITPLLSGPTDPASVLAQLNQLAGLNFYDGRTDYGRTLRQFHDDVGEQLDRRSTVLIFGDARGNYRPPEAGTLAHLARRAGAIYWLNPESASLWGTGDSDMTTYAPLCTRALTCRTLNDVRRFIEELD